VVMNYCDSKYEWGSKHDDSKNFIEHLEQNIKSSCRAARRENNDGYESCTTEIKKQRGTGRKFNGKWAIRKPRVDWPEASWGSTVYDTLWLYCIGTYRYSPTKVDFPYSWSTPYWLCRGCMWCYHVSNLWRK
jgi:hypothetical protein